MAIKWFNIRSGETQIAETEPQITAMWASSDHSPNITQGQDFGWRLAPEVVVEMKQIKQDQTTLERIAARYQRPLEDVGEPEILQWISDKTPVNAAPVAEEGDYTDQYEQAIRDLERPDSTRQTVTTTTTLTIEQMEAELARRKAEAGGDNTTTTTTTKRK